MEGGREAEREREREREEVRSLSHACVCDSYEFLLCFPAQNPQAVCITTTNSSYIPYFMPYFMRPAVNETDWPVKRGLH